MKSTIRQAQILEAAYKVSKSTGYAWIDLTRAEVAKEAKCAEGLINKYFGTMNKLKDSVMGLAVSRKCEIILEQGRIYNNKIARKASK